MHLHDIPESPLACSPSSLARPLLGLQWQERHRSPLLVAEMLQRSSRCSRCSSSAPPLLAGLCAEDGSVVPAAHTWAPRADQGRPAGNATATSSCRRSSPAQRSAGKRCSARAEAHEPRSASASPPPALRAFRPSPLPFPAEVGPPAHKRGPSGCRARSPAPACRSCATRLSHSPSSSSGGGASKRLRWLGSPCQEELRTSGRGGLEGLRCARRGGALRERWGDLLSRRSLVRCSLPRGRRVGARPEGRQPRRSRVPMNWRHRGQLDALAVQSWMHSLQKMCLQGRARTASAIGPRQMGHGSSWASAGHVHVSRLLLLLAAASRLMAAAALAL